MLNITNNGGYNVSNQNAILKMGIENYQKELSNNEEDALFVDKVEISDDAMELLQRDDDIKKFTQLLLSDLDSSETESLMAENVFSKASSTGNDFLAETLLSNEQFINDLLG